MEEKKKRDFYFKYVGFDGAKKIISSNQLKFSHPKTFNDPFDIQYDPYFPFSRIELAEEMEKRFFSVLETGTGIGRENPHPGSLGFVDDLENTFSKIKSGQSSIDQEMAHIKINLPIYLDEFYAEIKKMQIENRKLISDVAVCCFAENPDNLLMWGHYSSKHEGAVLRLKPIVGRDSFFEIVFPVSYQQEIPVIQKLDRFLDELFGLKKPDYNNFYLEWLLTKSKSWNYEKEWRAVAPGRLKGDQTHELVSLQKGEIDQIILGCRMPEGVKGEIINLCKKFQPQAKILQAKKHGQKFELIIEPLTP